MQIGSVNHTNAYNIIQKKINSSDLEEIKTFLYKKGYKSDNIKNAISHFGYLITKPVCKPKIEVSAIKTVCIRWVTISGPLDNAALLLK